MRIGLFSDTFVPEINGVANSTYILFQELKKHGHDVYVITTNNTKDNFIWNEEHDILRLNGIQLKFLYGYIMTSPFHAEVLEIVRSLKLEIIHAQTEFGIGIFARICAKQLNVPLVSTYHTTYEDYTHYINFIHSKMLDEVAKLSVAKLSKMYGESSQEVIAPSQKTKEMLQKYGIKKPITVIPTGLDLACFNPAYFDDTKRIEIRKKYGFSLQRPIIIYVGRLAKEKAIDLVIDGFQIAHNEGAQSQLVIVGSGPDFDKLKKMVFDMQLQKEVIFTGPIKREFVPDLYRSANCFVSASLSETQGMTFIEALASGLPLMARKDEVLNNLLVIDKTGWYFDDAQSLAQKIKQFEALSQLTYQQYRKEAIQKAKNYDAENFYQKVISVYKRVIKQTNVKYEILHVRMKDNTIELYLRNSNDDESRLCISIDDYDKYSLHIHGFLNQYDYEILKQKEIEILAYQACLRKLAFKDYSQKEIIDWLTKNSHCSLESICSIIKKLNEKKYLNDERYASEQVNNLFLSLLGKKEIKRRLIKKGIAQELIDKLLSDNAIDEIENALKYANKLIKNSHYSCAKTKAVIQQKLFQRGYNEEIIDKVMERLDFSLSMESELTSLAKYVLKASKKYSRKYQGHELHDHIVRYCLSKGYSIDDINKIIDERKDFYD